MPLSKSAQKILQVFTANLAEAFTLREAARKAGMNVSLAHRTVKTLVEKRILLQDKHKRLSVNLHSDEEILSSVEYVRRNEFFSRPKNKDIGLFAEDVAKKIKEDAFILLLFGSAVESTKPRDIDVLLIVDNAEKIEFHERFLRMIASNYGAPFEERVVCFGSVYEMLAKRDEMNLMNEILNKHIILHGGELFYRLIRRGRL